MEKLLSIREAAELMNVQEETIRHWLRSGKLEGLKAGRVWRVKPAAVEEFLGIVRTENIEPEQLDMYFKDDYHKDLYINMLANVPSSGSKHNIACYLLAAVGQSKIVNYMTTGINFEGIRKELNLSIEEDTVVQIAGNLYDGIKCDMNILSRLDEDNLRVVLEAIKSRYIF